MEVGMDLRVCGESRWNLMERGRSVASGRAGVLGWCGTCVDHRSTHARARTSDDALQPRARLTRTTVPFSLVHLAMDSMKVCKALELDCKPSSAIETMIGGWSRGVVSSSAACLAGSQCAH